MGLNIYASTITEMPESLYDVLGVGRQADVNEIKSAYKKLAVKNHPDKGGNEETFKKISRAHEILSDDNRRAIYDQTGSEDGEGMPQGMPFGFGGMPFDMASMFGGMFGGGMPQQQQRRQKAPPKVHEMPISLFDFYHGKKVTMKFERQRFCTGCKGEGSEGYEKCGECGGSGTKQSVMMIGPGMHAVTRGPCMTCGGLGKRATKSCGVCQGKKFQLQEKKLEIVIEPGMKPNDQRTFPCECSDQHEYVEAGDVHIIFQAADEDSGFTRVNDDLHIGVEVGLADALLGCRKTVKGHPAHLEGFEVTLHAGVQNGETVTIVEEGMPRRGAQGAKGRGNLNVLVTVKVSQEEKDLLVKPDSVEALRKIFITGDALTHDIKEQS